MVNESLDEPSVSNREPPATTMNEVSVSIRGSSSRVSFCVKMMCNAKKRAHATVMSSPAPHDRCGGPSMNPAPIVAMRTPQYRARRGGCWLKRTVSKAVITTYSEVRKADVDGLMSLRATIWLTNPTSISPPRMPPPFQTGADFSPAIVFGKAMRTSTMAMEKRRATRNATTGKVPNVSISTSNAFSACFIQMKVAPQTSVTTKRTIAAFRRWGTNGVTGFTPPSSMVSGTPCR